MTHRDRIEALRNGEKPDRMPVSFWRHFYDSESTSEQLADAMLKFQNKFEWDLMKINPRASYHLEDWGNKYKYTGKPEDKPERLEYAVKNSKDWEKIGYLSPQTEVLAEHIKAVELIKKSVPDSLPVVMTVFNPISIAGDLVENDQFLVDEIHNNADSVHEVLKNISRTFIDVIKAYMEIGIDGIFFATTQWASKDLISEDEYKVFGRKYDMMVLEEVMPLTKMNVLHVCSGSNMLGLFKDYPIDIVNWDMNDSTNADAEKGAQILDNKIIMGGVDRKGLLQTGSPEELETMVARYMEFAERHRFILAPDCSVPVTTPDENLRIIKTKIEQSA